MANQLASNTKLGSYNILSSSVEVAYNDQTLNNKVQTE